METPKRGWLESNGRFGRGDQFADPREVASLEFAEPGLRGFPEIGGDDPFPLVNGRPESRK